MIDAPKLCELCGELEATKPDRWAREPIPGTLHYNSRGHAAYEYERFQTPYEPGWHERYCIICWKEGKDGLGDPANPCPPRGFIDWQDEEAYQTALRERKERAA